MFWMLSVRRGSYEARDLHQINNPPLDFQPLVSSPSEVPRHWSYCEHISQVTAMKTMRWREKIRGFPPLFPQWVRESESKRGKGWNSWQMTILYLSFLLFWEHLLICSYFLKETVYDLDLHCLWVFPSIRGRERSFGVTVSSWVRCLPGPLRRNSDSPSQHCRIPHLLLLTCSSLGGSTEEQKEEE